MFLPLQGGMSLAEREGLEAVNEHRYPRRRAYDAPTDSKIRDTARG